MKTRYLLLIMLFCLFRFFAYCQQTWIPLNNPVGSEVVSIKIDSTNTKMYISTFYPIVHIGVDSSSTLIWDGSNFSLMGELSGYVNNFAYYHNYLYGCGAPNYANGQGVAEIAKYNGLIWEGISGSGPNDGGGGDNSFNCMQVYHNDLYTGGWYGNVIDTLGGTPLNTGNVARWNGQHWDTVGGVFYGGDGIYAFTTYKNELYIGGVNMTPPHLSSYNCIYKWNDTIWSPVGNNVNDYIDTVFAMAVMDGKLYAAGTFTSINGQAANRIAVWDGTAWDSLAGGGMNKRISCLYADTANHLLYAGGRFTTAGGKPANNIAYWNGSQWNAMGQGMNNFVYTINKFQGSIYAGGDFTTADGHPCNNIAYWGCCTGVNEVQDKSKDFKLYPNPNNGNMTLEYNIGTSDKGELDLYDFTGRHLKTYILNASSTTMEINESQWSNGIYFYRVLVNNTMIKADKLVIIK